MLLALSSTSRACTLHCLDLNFLSKFSHYVKFQFGRLNKGWRNSKSSPSVSYYKFKDDESLCFVHTLQIYIERSKEWRNDLKTQLLLSYIKPHDEVTSSTVSGWIKKVIGLAGINTEVFTGHSSRSASSTGASLTGASVSDILKMGSWSQESVWQRFYNKPIITPEESFQNNLLKKSLSCFEQRMRMLYKMYFYVYLNNIFTLL